MDNVGVLLDGPGMENKECDDDDGLSCSLLACFFINMDPNSDPEGDFGGGGTGTLDDLLGTGGGGGGGGGIAGILESKKDDLASS